MPIRTNVKDKELAQEITNMESHLKDLAWCAKNVHINTGQETILFCVEICERWHDLANQITQQSHYVQAQVIRTFKEISYVTGVCDVGLCNIALILKPELKEDLDEALNEGWVRLLIFCTEDIVAFEITVPNATQVC